MDPTYRRRVHGCIHPETYKYFLDPEFVAVAWEAMEELLGPVRRGESLPTMEIQGTRLWVRATTAGNPVTVIRKRGHTEHDLERLHSALRFQEKGSVCST